jgi:hypothetical protein
VKRDALLATAALVAMLATAAAGDEAPPRAGSLLDALRATAWFDLPEPRVALTTSLSTSPWSGPSLSAGTHFGVPRPGLGTSVSTFARTHDGGVRDLHTALRAWSASTDGGAWIGLSAPVSNTISRPVFELGAWRENASLRLTAAVQQGSVVIDHGLRLARAEQFIAETTLVDTGVVHYPAVWERDRDHELTTSLLAGVAWRHGWLHVSSHGGFTIARQRRPSRWARADVAATVNPLLAWFASVGPPVAGVATFDRPEPTEVRFGLRLTADAEAYRAWRRARVAEAAEVAQAPPALWAVRLASGACALRVHAPRVRSVEIEGDMTDWTPVALARAGAGEWELRVALDPGVYQVRMRVGGGRWAPPPGLPSTVDLEGRPVGMLVVE